MKATAKSQRQHAGETSETSELVTAAHTTVDPLAALKLRLGVGDEPIPYTTETVPVAALVVNGQRLIVRRAEAFRTNIALVGILHAPSVERLEDGSYQVIAGRSRALALASAGYETCEAHVYRGLTAPQRALIKASENIRRTPAWIDELAALIDLVEGQAALTYREVADALGVRITDVEERMQMAKLPRALRTEILEGRVDQRTAKLLCRLSPQRQGTCVDIVQANEELNFEVVKGIMTAQLGALAAPLSAALAMGDTTPASEADVSHETSRETMPAAPAAPATSAAKKAKKGAAPAAEPEVEEAPPAPTHAGIPNSLYPLSVKRIVAVCADVERDLDGHAGGDKAAFMARALAREVQALAERAWHAAEAAQATATTTAAS